MFEDIIKAISESEKIIVLTHLSPDPDALGSAFGMAYALDKHGKHVRVLLLDEIKSSLSFMIGKYEVYNDENEYEYDTVICLDSGDLGRLDKTAQLLSKAKCVINIDHHKDNAMYGSINHVEPTAAATGEIVYDLLCSMNPSLVDTRVATWLYTAIIADTGSFKYSNTSSKTLRKSADLLECGVDIRAVNKQLFDTVDLPLLKLKAEVIGSLETFADGAISCIAVTADMMDRNKICDEEVNGIVDIARSLRDVEVAISIKESDEKYKVSLRSEKFVDVGKVANKFDGGGHARAAGLAIGKEVSIAEVKKMLVDECIKALESGENF